MKLIDLLVQELPKRGGWPDGAEYCHLTQYDRHCLTITFSHNQIGTGNNLITSKEEMVFPGIGYLGDTLYGCIVTAKEYESALSASQKPAWNGEGLPPVGCECVVTPHNTVWGFSSVDDYTGRVLAYDGEDFWFAMLGGVKVTSRTDKVDFRPIKSEADKKRDTAINNILTIIDCNGVDPKNSAIQIYDAIAAGKIPGVKLDD